MGGRGSSSHSYKSVPNSGTGMKLKPKGFTIDTNMPAYGYQRIDTGMSPDEVVRMAGDQLVGQKHEFGALVAQDGTLFIMTDRDEHSTHHPYTQARAAGYNIADLMPLHNHPGQSKSGLRTLGGPSSSDDWNVMISQGHKVGHIVAKEGRYTMRLTGSDTTKAQRFFTTAWGTKTSNYTKNTRKTYNNGAYWGADGYLKAAMHTLQKFGPRYGFELTFSPNPGYERIYD